MAEQRALPNKTPSNPAPADFHASPHIATSTPNQQNIDKTPTDKPPPTTGLPPPSLLTLPPRSAHLDCVDERTRQAGRVKLTVAGRLVVDEVCDDACGERKQAAAKRLSVLKHYAQAAVQALRVGVVRPYARAAAGRVAADRNRAHQVLHQHLALVGHWHLGQRARRGSRRLRRRHGRERQRWRAERNRRRHGAGASCRGTAAENTDVCSRRAGWRATCIAAALAALRDHAVHTCLGTTVAGLPARALALSIAHALGHTCLVREALDHFMQPVEVAEHGGRAGAVVDERLKDLDRRGDDAQVDAAPGAQQRQQRADHASICERAAALRRRHHRRHQRKHRVHKLGGVRGTAATAAITAAARR
eukprot:347842-Chlamydomonas_euryale.AAC.7